MTLAPRARLRLTVDLHKPEKWSVPLAYKLSERGGRPFVGGIGVATRDGFPTIALPLEMLPFLAEVDLESDEAIIGFIQRFGPLKAWPEAFLLMQTSTFTAPPDLRLGPLLKVREEHAMWGWDQSGEFLDEFRIAASGLQVLIATMLELERARFSGARLAAQWSRFAPWPGPEDEGRAVPLPNTRETAWWFLREAINEGLRSSPFALWYVREGEPTDGWNRGFHAGPPFMLHPALPESLYGACILELVDHVLAADRPYRICANERCGRLFSMQEGRSTSGEHRTERVKYHSTACKAAQESREYRRRQAGRGRKG